MYSHLLKSFINFLVIISMNEANLNENSYKFDIIRPNVDNYFNEMQLLLMAILQRTKINHCYAIITDEDHEQIFTGTFFKISLNLQTNYILKLLNSEDLRSPNYRTVKILQQIKTNNCDLIFILLFNGIQVKHLLIFLDNQRILNFANFILLYDYRIFEKDFHFIWKKIISVIFIQQLENVENSVKFNLVTVPFPYHLQNTFVSKKISEWKNGKLTKRKNLFINKTNNLKGISLNVVLQEHIPMVIKRDTNDFVGIEVNILQVLANVMNFTIEFYESSDLNFEIWGRKLFNGTYTNLIGEMVSERADIAVGDLYMNKFNLDLMDLTIPHSRGCLTFLTPEQTADNSWKTLILPFTGNMWAGVLITLLLVGTIFYTFSRLYSAKIQSKIPPKSKFFTSKQVIISKRKFIARKRLQIHTTNDIFDEFSNCILLTYSMMLLVSLPQMPKNWPLRILTGWYWIYCILLAVIYRSSFTAILANPSPRITIDTLKDLADSSIIVGAWGEENKHFFQEAFDENLQKIGDKMEEIQDINGTVERIIRGNFAYYDNEYFLRYLRTQGRTELENSGEELHIMKECVINMPISIGLEKNSPLKENFDKYIQRLIEAGFISKWLKDYTNYLSEDEKGPQEALMDLKKFWSSFVVLMIGYILAIFALIVEKYHFKYKVEQHPIYDPYNQRIFYDLIRRKKLERKFFQDYFL